MLAARHGLAVALRRSDDEDPVADGVLALTMSTAAVIALVDLVAGRLPLSVAPGLVVLLGTLLRFRRIAIVAAIVVWVATLGVNGASGFAAMLMIVGTCLALLAGPGHVLDWLEERWDARNERLRQERDARAITAAAAVGVGAIGWIEDLPELPVAGGPRPPWG